MTETKPVIIDGQRGTFFPEDPGHEFERILREEIKNGGCKPYWMTDEFHEEGRNQYRLEVYKNTSSFVKFQMRLRLLHDDFDVLKGPPRRKDGSLIEYHNMNDDTFYRVKQYRNCDVCGNEYEVGASPSLWCDGCRGCSGMKEAIKCK